MPNSPTQIFDQATYIGQSVDIFKQYQLPDALLGSMPIELNGVPTRPFVFLGHEVQLPVFVNGIQATEEFARSDCVESREEFQNSIAAQAEVHAGIGAFSGQMSVSYGKEFSSTSQYFFAYQMVSVRLGILQIELGDVASYLSSSYLADLRALPDWPDPKDLEPFVNFFNQWGLYYVKQLSLGGSLDYYVAVNKSSSLSTTSISESMKVEYKALFASGGASESITSKESWKTYSSNRSVSIRARGGDYTYLSALINADPEKASDGKAVDAYNQWNKSVASEPIVCDFKVGHIWELTTEKREVLKEAFDLMQHGMRPRLVIETNSTNNTLPTITLGKPLVPIDPPEWPQGYQVVVLDRENPTATGVKWNRYYSTWFEEGNYAPIAAMYNQIQWDLEALGLDNTRHVLVMVSFGMSFAAAPQSRDIYPLLRSAGGGPWLQYWSNHCDPASSIFYWGASYVLAGVFGFGPNTGVEAFVGSWEHPTWYNPIVQEVFFYRESGTSYHTLSSGGGIVETPLRRSFTTTGLAPARNMSRR